MLDSPGGQCEGEGSYAPSHCPPARNKQDFLMRTWNAARRPWIGGHGKKERKKCALGRGEGSWCAILAARGLYQPPPGAPSALSVAFLWVL